MDPAALPSAEDVLQAARLAKLVYDLPSARTKTKEAFDEFKEQLLDDSVEDLQEKRIKHLLEGLQKACPNGKLEMFEKNSVGNEVAVLSSETRQRIAICFRGTETTSILDIWTDVKVLKRGLQPGAAINFPPQIFLVLGLCWLFASWLFAMRGTLRWIGLAVSAALGIAAWVHRAYWRSPLVHSGFHKAYYSDELENKLFTGHEKACPTPWIGIDAFLRAKPNYDVVITGHSLGGALAILCGVRLASTRPDIKAVHVINFGCPRTGNQRFMELANSLPNLSIHRVVNNNDIVPRFPTLGYKHVGHTILVNVSPGELAKAYKWNRGTPANMWYLWNLSGSDHSMTNYVKALDKIEGDTAEPWVASYAPEK